MKFTSTAERYLQWIIAIALFAVGIYSVPLKIMGLELSHIPGDMGDARFNLYILEHGYKYFAGEVSSYWNAPIMYPTENVIARSDNFLGTIPLYALFRSLGLNTYSALQYWFLTLCALNFICCFWALLRLVKFPLIAATGAYIFAFGLFNIGQIYHFQVFPRFLMPVLFYWVLIYLEKRNIRYLYYVSAGIVFQFYCGIYLGFFSIYMVLALILGYLIASRDISVITQFKRSRLLVLLLASVALAGLALVPLMAPYAEMGKSVGMRSYGEIFDSIPKLSSYFYAFPSSLPWGSLLYEPELAGVEGWWLHFLYPGALPWLGILCALALLFSKRFKAQKARMAVLLSAFVIAMVFALRTDSFSAYKVVYSLPGFSSMRAVMRIINVNIIFFVFILSFVLLWVRHSGGLWGRMLYLVPFLTFADQAYTLDYNIKRFEIAEAQAVEEKYREALRSKSFFDCDAVLVMLSEETKSDHDLTIDHHISAMLAAQALDITLVNAYTGSYPNGYMNLFDQTDTATLSHWCDLQGISMDKIKMVSVD